MSWYKHSNQCIDIMDKLWVIVWEANIVKLSQIKVILCVFCILDDHDFPWLNKQLRVVHASCLTASWSEISTYIHLVSRREQRCSCPCSRISSRNWSKLSDKLWCNRNITQNSWIQCLMVRDKTVFILSKSKQLKLNSTLKTNLMR